MKKLSLLIAAVASFVGCCAALADTWPRFRGSNGDGQSDATGIPASWTDKDYLWKVSLPGLGHSSPVVWEERIFVTSADKESGEQIILCFSAATGEKLWEKRFESAPHPQHAANSFATSTPALDADALYVAWMSGQTVMLGAFSHVGDELWTVEAAQLDEQHGYGTSPVVVGDVVVLDNETEAAENSAVLGFDRKTGERLWRTPRGTGKTSFMTPCVVESGGKQLVATCSMGAGFTAFDPKTGEVVWNAASKDLPDRCVSSPILTHGLILVSCGSGNNGLHLIAVKPGEGGAEPTEAYRIRQGVPNLPTPIVAGDLLILWHDRGTVTCYDVNTGEKIWLKRVGGMFFSSPLRIGDRIYCVSTEGEVVVLAASKEYELVARVDLGEHCQATPAVANNCLVLRTESTLSCLGTRSLTGRPERDAWSR